jgi:ABC-2 type transport system ATP-binding protein
MATMAEPTDVTPDAPELVQVEHLHRYYGERCAVRDVSFTLEPGDVLGLLGPNGAGKTTTLQLLTGNLAPSAGRILIDGADLLDHPQAAKAAIGYLPEHPPLYPELTVDEYLTYCARLHRIARRRVRTAVDAVKGRCGLEAIGRRLIGNLSKGVKQRVGLAQALVHDPRVIVLDEPTVGLDPIQIREIRDLIRELGDTHGVILSTHLLAEVEATCNRVQILHEGRLVYAERLGGVHTGAQPTVWVVAFREPPTTPELAALPGVLAVEALSAGRFRVQCDGRQAAADALVAQSVARRWGLRELTPERPSLEQVFVALTVREQEAA